MKFDWKYGENRSQTYYDCEVNGTYLCVFKNNWESVWMVMVDDVIIRDKTQNDRQRKKQGLPKGCDTSLLRYDHMLCGKEPEKLMKKAEHCFKYHKTEISNK